MSQRQPATQYKLAFLARVTAAREARRLTQEGIAELLDIPQDKYKQYEKRSFLPHELVHRFCLACDVEMDWLFTGRGRGPAVLPKPEKVVKRRGKLRRHVA